MKPTICKKMNFQECEMAILKQAVDNSEERAGKKIANSPEIIKIFSIVEKFLHTKQLIAYGGIAINAILPKENKIYNLDIELPDYDFFSPNAMDDAIELADIYFKQGFDEVEAKPGMHFGTYKVFVNFLPVADITYLHKDIFLALKREAILVDKILYTPPNYLRMSMYLELSRPSGDVSRWEKVFKRLILVNKHYPLTGIECNKVKFQRNMTNKYKDQSSQIFEITKDAFIDQDVVFFGGYALSLYSRYMDDEFKNKINITDIPDFDVLSEDPEMTAKILQTRLSDNGFKNVNIIKKDKIGEIIAEHYMINIGKDTIAFIYKPLACHSYNIISLRGNKIKVATIDTMLSFYLAFIYSNRSYYDVNRILCMAHFLFKVQQQNRLEQKGILKRFSINCYGHQPSIEELREEKSEMFKKLKDKKGTREYDEYFLRYRPSDINKNKKTFNSLSKKAKNKGSSATSSSSKSISKSSASSSSSSSKSISKSTSPSSSSSSGSNTKKTKTKTKKNKNKKLWGLF
jgi:hypothetical protein